MKEDDHQARTSPNLTEIESIHTLLKDATLNKLSDRDVMIPITTKAFVEGRLMPTTTVMKNDAQEKEQVIVKLGKEYLAEMSLDDACSYIERRMKDLRPLVKDSISSTTKPKAEFKMKKGFLNDKKSKSRTQKNQEEEKNPREKIPIPRNDEPTLPFMDIVEEYDESGNQVKAEALDVSKQLIDFQRKIKGQYQHDETKESFNAPVELSTDLDDDSLDQDNNESNEKVPTKTQSYEALSARLDELALLEEEE
jgi:prefoldin subunit 5